LWVHLSHITTAKYIIAGPAGQTNVAIKSCRIDAATGVKRDIRRAASARFLCDDDKNKITTRKSDNMLRAVDGDRMVTAPLVNSHLYASRGESGWL